jgi:hypothetical protein
MSKKITDLNTMTDSEVADNDLVVVEDVSVPQTRGMQFQYLNPSFKVSTQTGNYTITRDHEVVFASGDITITLAAASNSFHSIIINIGTGNVIYAIGTSGDTIEGDVNRVLTHQFETVELIANGANLYAEL